MQNGRNEYKKKWAREHQESRAISRRKYYLKNKEKYLQWGAEYKARNKDKVKIWSKNHRLKYKEEIAKYKKDHRNIEKERLRQSKHYANHKETIVERAKQWHKENPEKARAIKRKYLYGLSQLGYIELLLKQDGKCAICDNEMNGWHEPQIDHDHKTGKVRGLLCGKCNTGLAKFRENTTSLLKAIKYLKH